MKLAKKVHKKFPTNLSSKNSILQFGYYGIKSCSFKKLTLNNSNYLQFLLEKYLKQIVPNKRIKVWNRIVMNSTLTRLSPESRMGKGKGNIYAYFTYIKPGQILFEIEKIDFKYCSKIFKKIYKQLGFMIKIVSKA